MSDLSARLDRLADLAEKAQAEQLERINDLTLSREATNDFIAAADPLAVAALVKVAQAAEQPQEPA